MNARRIYPSPEVSCPYEVQEIFDGPNPSYRITQIIGDNRLSTSYDLSNAKLICDALNNSYGPKKLFGIELELSLVESEVHRAKAKHGPQKFNSTHEGYAVLLEEVDELKAEVWKSKHDKDKMREEAIQIAAMAVRFANELCK